MSSKESVYGMCIKNISRAIRDQEIYDLNEKVVDKMKKYIVHLLYGSNEEVKGTSISDAIAMHGYVYSEIDWYVPNNGKKGCFWCSGTGEVYGGLTCICCSSKEDK